MGYTQYPPSPVNVGCNFTDPNDSSDYFFGIRFVSAASPAATYASFIIPYPCTIRKVAISWLETAVAATNENISMYIRKNDTTDYLIKTIGVASGAPKIFSNYAMNVPVSAGNSFEIKVSTPAWVTNPSGVFAYGMVYFE